MSNKENLIQRINDKEAVVGVIGLGYVGLPLAVENAKAGYKTIGFDLQKDKVEKVNNGENYIDDIEDAELKTCVERGMLKATDNFKDVNGLDFIAICVPTPLDDYKVPDISYIESSAKEISKYMKKNTVVVLESTTYPGTTEEVLLPILEDGSGLKCGEDFYLAFSPERVDPGNKDYKTNNTPKVLGGIGADSTDIAARMYENVLSSKIYKVSSPGVAEMEKILENTYRNINIGLANEMALICEKMGIDVWEVIDAAKTKPYGFQAFYPGPGLGGHCIPLDPYYLNWKAKEYNYQTRLIETSGAINDKMPAYVIERVMKILNVHKKAINGSKVLVLGVAYKQDINDYRESASLEVIELLEEAKAKVDYHDPYVADYYHNGSVKTGIDSIDESVISDYDIVIITTAHSNLDYEMIQKNAKMIFDTRNAMKHIKVRDNIELL